MPSECGFVFILKIVGNGPHIGIRGCGAIWQGFYQQCVPAGRVFYPGFERPEVKVPAIPDLGGGAYKIG